MLIQQLSVFLDNSPGRLNAATKVLSEAGINMRALTLADTSDFGVLRVIVDKPEEAMAILRKNNFAAKMTEVLVVEMEDTPGGLTTILDILEDGGINIEYMYAFAGTKPRKALMIFRVNKADEAIDLLKSKNVRLFSTEEDIDELIHVYW
ncbi:amino acid-binding protein [Acidaminobacter hydrogenoformans]|uniref:ACT domain protein n=1 Tax=Acidaminobacter hydrogenoformans DSM 2784 TaxID=1120920 RepID=A0A1G5RVI8_9FIRM|nr:amino acid-binding protein [Acidaminobacter hydrogenoformans]SCZ77339.1 ACT domain protein [Acidaminobacter hydrogenoformans DSM 2784]